MRINDPHRCRGVCSALPWLHLSIACPSLCQLVVYCVRGYLPGHIESLILANITWRAMHIMALMEMCQKIRFLEVWCSWTKLLCSRLQNTITKSSASSLLDTFVIGLWLNGGSTSPYHSSARLHTKVYEIHVPVRIFTRITAIIMSI